MMRVLASFPSYTKFGLTPSTTNIRLPSFAESGNGLVLAECDPRLGRAEDWRLDEFTPLPGHRAALAWHPLPAPQSEAAIMAR